MVRSNDRDPRLDTRAEKSARLRATISEQWRGSADASVVDELSADRLAAATREKAAE